MSRPRGWNDPLVSDALLALPLDLDRFSDQRRHDFRKPQIGFVERRRGEAIRYLVAMKCCD